MPSKGQGSSWWCGPNRPGRGLPSRGRTNGAGTVRVWLAGVLVEVLAPFDGHIAPILFYERLQGLLNKREPDLEIGDTNGKFSVHFYFVFSAACPYLSPDSNFLAPLECLETVAADLHSLHVALAGVPSLDPR